MRSGGGAIIGYMLGGAVIVPLILWLISIIFYAPNKVTEAIIQQYIKESIIIKDSIEAIPFKEYLDLDGKIGGIHTKTITLYLAKATYEGKRDYFCYGFYSKKFHKYFQFTTMVEGIWTFDNILNGNVKNIIATVNEKDLNNPDYGSTMDNQVPVLKFVGADASIRPDNKDYDQTYMDTTYYNNVKMYLEYIMPKKEFKARFGK